MGSTSWIVTYIVVSFTIFISKGKQIQLNVICGDLLYSNCEREISKHDKVYRTLNANSLKLSVKLKKGSDDLFTNYQLFNVTNDFWNIFLAFGDDVTTNAAATVAISNNAPILLYDMTHWKSNVSILSDFQWFIF